MEIILYSTNCVNCLKLEKMLKMKGVKYKKINDIDSMLEKGFTTAPVIEVNGKIMNYTTAKDWLDKGMEE